MGVDSETDADSTPVAGGRLTGPAATPIVLELGSWRVRTGPAGAAVPEERAPGEAYKEGTWLGRDIARFLDESAPSVLVVESCSALHDVTRIDVLEALFAERPRLCEVSFLRGAAASAFAVGRVNGVVLDIGEAAAVASPVSDGFVHQCAVERGPVAGAVTSARLREHIPEGADVDRAKRQLLSVGDVDRSEHLQYELPDGQCVQLRTASVDEMCSAVINQLPALLRAAVDHVEGEPRKLAQSADVVLVGGCSLLRGVAAATFDYTRARALNYVATHGADRTIQNWRGGSIVASLSSHSELAISRADFDEHGAAQLLSRCP